MAKGIITCQGETINIGDTVETEDGQIITVQGAAIGVSFHNAETCRLVPKGTKPDKSKQAAEPADQSRAGIARASDCVIWGT